MNHSKHTDFGSNWLSNEHCVCITCKIHLHKFLLSFYPLLLCFFSFKVQKTVS